ncbi:MAG: hypothetical protein RSD49_22710 [Hafnia sp.]
MTGLDSVNHFIKHKDSAAFRKLCDLYGYSEAVKEADEWIEFVQTVKRALKKLVARYLDEHVNCPGRVWAISNAVRQTFMINPDEITVSVRRRVLSHMNQGIESRAIYETILANPGVCSSFEHDGLVTNGDICWHHPYLKLKMKDWPTWYGNHSYHF